MVVVGIGPAQYPAWVHQQQKAPDPCERAPRKFQPALWGAPREHKKPRAMAFVGRSFISTSNFSAFFDHVASWLDTEDSRIPSGMRHAFCKSRGSACFSLHTEIAEDLGRLEHARNPHLVEIP